MVIYEQCGKQDCSGWSACQDCMECGAPPHYFARGCVYCRQFFRQARIKVLDRYNAVRKGCE